MMSCDKTLQLIYELLIINSSAAPVLQNCYQSLLHLCSIGLYELAVVLPRASK